MKVITVLTLFLVSKLAYGGLTLTTDCQETNRNPHLVDLSSNSSSKKEGLIEQLIKIATTTAEAATIIEDRTTTSSTTAPSTQVAKTRKSKMLVRIKVGNKSYKVDCAPFCRRTSSKNYALNCNRLKQPLFELCAFCRLRYKCGTSDQVFI